MDLESRLVVTGHDGDQSVFIDDRPIEAVTADGLDGLTFFMAWGTPDGVTRNDDASSKPVFTPYFPGPGGTRFLLVTWPAEGPPPTDADPDALAAGVEAVLPGLFGSFEPDNPGMHTSETIDYGVVLSGEISLELDAGKEVRLIPGACVVQRGTRHRWSNRSDKPATVAFVLVGTSPRGNVE